MKFIRFGVKGAEKPGLLDSENSRRDLSEHFDDWNGSFFAGNGVARLKEIAARGIEHLPPVPESERWAAPVARPGKILCIGLNYSDHAAETGAEPPKEPIIFLKAPNTTSGPFDAVHIPRGSLKTDWEVELGVVIGAEARYLPSPDAALGCVAGYCLSHDVSERAFQKERGGQWTKGKSCDTFNPLGPWLATPDEIPSPDGISMKLWVNGDLRQKGTTAKMIFNVPFLIHYISQFMTLEPGDLISTGTPPGVGMGMKPPQYLKAGDVVELEMDHLGRQKQTCIPAP
jgi:2-keto-4-pentenoate hydratase/2-oxohepta-3-ene-1,7-dioic acid hydratase in catechol pathway